MKTILTCLLAIVLFTVQGQTKKQLLSEVNTFKVEAIMNAEIKASESNLNSDISQFLKEYGLNKYEKSTHHLTFIKERKRPRRATRTKVDLIPINDPLNSKLELRDRSEKLVDHDRFNYRHKDIQKISIIIEGTKAKSINMEAYETTDKWYATADDIFFKLKKHLYLKHIGNDIELPEALKIKIQNFNDLQKKDKNKLLAGTNY